MGNVKHILIIHQGAIGDFILSLPAVGSFRQRYPDAAIEVWGYPAILQLVEKRFYADSIASIDRKEIARFYSENTTLDAELVARFREFDLIIIFGGERQKTLVRNLERIQVKEVYSITTFPPAAESTHIIDYQLSQLLPLGYESPDKIPRLFPGESDLTQASDLFSQRQPGGKALTVAMHIGGGSKKKVWPAGCFAQLSEKLIKEDDAEIIVPLGPADEEVAQEYFNLIDSNAISPLNNLPLTRLAAVLKKCSLYLGNDTGITHLAAAVGTPVVALFGPTDPRVWGPRGDNVSILYKASECSPCSREEMSGCVHKKCLEGITVEEVYEKVKETRGTQ
jgi:ADP-heptose:LPS heptosyltransferase